MRTPKKTSSLPCSEGCNDAEFELLNGEETQLYCEPSMEDALLDIVSNTEGTITFAVSHDTKRKLIVVEIL